MALMMWSCLLGNQIFHPTPPSGRWVAFKILLHPIIIHLRRTFSLGLQIGPQKSVVAFFIWSKAQKTHKASEGLQRRRQCPLPPGITVVPPKFGHGGVSSIPLNLKETTFIWSLKDSDQHRCRFWRYSCSDAKHMWYFYDFGHNRKKMRNLKPFIKYGHSYGPNNVVMFAW